jgi:2,4-dienoyl-CoA reductase-like NADH-dependent reductase (Old Yellow Enzyme family)/pyruvate/2-oxoglutarate dehydrogenase complex dihydrolipoamide dehydrogenase (E3) component
MNFPQLFTQLQLRHKTLRNRVVFGAHTANMAEQGLPGARHLGYYLERAKGGAAMIVVEPVPVHRTAVLTRGNMRHSDDAIIEPLRVITDACHAEGTVMIQQLYHVGQHGDFDNSYAPSWSPSGLPSFHDSDGSHAMNEAEIYEIIDSFVAAAVRAQKAGFDGVELFGAYNGLIEQFWLPWTNRRTDQWGGSLDNRMRFSEEIAQRIRAAVGNDFIIGMNASIDSGVPIALQLDALCEIAQWLDSRQLIDYISCGSGGYFNFAELMPTFQFPDKLGAPYAEALKKVVRFAKVQAESHFRTPENANYAVASGQADMVSIVRGQIADPHLANKAKEGRAEDVRGCISCNQMCWGRRSRDYWISCLINPSAGREFEWGGDRFEKAQTVKSVLVVGAGPAGMETARVAAERGHKVTLVEAGPQLGGAFRLAGMQPRRSQILELIAWYERQLKRLNVDVRLNTPLDGDEIKAFGADSVLLATGSQPTMTGFQRGMPQQDHMQGVGLANVWSIEDVMGKLAKPGKRVVLVDDTGDWRGAGTAWYLAEQGHEVTIVTTWPMVGFWIQRTAGDGKLRSRLTQLGATWMTEAAVISWHGDGATVRNLLDGKESKVASDALILATTNLSETSLAEDLSQMGIEHAMAGDNVSPRLAVHAIYEGRVAGMQV